jgi:hypothetical protein
VSLAENRDMTLESIKEGLGVVASLDPVATIGAYFESLVQGFQARGIYDLLVDVDSEALFKNLLFSAYTRRYYLQRNAAEGDTENEFLATSRTTSFFDAIAAGHPGLATEIAALSPKRWIPDGEYEDDYCYYDFFHELLPQLPKPEPTILEPILAQFAKAAEGKLTPRYFICESLLKQDANQFADAFQSLLAEREQELKKSKLWSNDDATFAARNAVFVEGLALLWFAERIGISTQDEYLFCPQVARVSTPPPLPPDIFAAVEAAMRN